MLVVGGSTILSVALAGLGGAHSTGSRPGVGLSFFAGCDGEFVGRVVKNVQNVHILVQIVEVW